MKKAVQFMLVGAALFALLVALTVIVTLAEGQQTCPDGGAWHKIDSDDLSLYPVDGAVEYCFKAGSDKSQGCEGGLFDELLDFGNDDLCGLSHWSYKLGDPTATDEPTSTPGPTETPVPSETPTDEPTATSEPTATGTLTATPEGDPTPTPTFTASPEPTVTPTDKPRRKPSETPCPYPQDFNGDGIIDACGAKG